MKDCKIYKKELVKDNKKYANIYVSVPLANGGNLNVQIEPKFLSKKQYLLLLGNLPLKEE